MKASSLSGECATVISRTSVLGVVAMLSVVDLRRRSSAPLSGPMSNDGGLEKLNPYVPLSPWYAASPGAKCRSPLQVPRSCSIRESRTEASLRTRERFYRVSRTMSRVKGITIRAAVGKKMPFREEGHQAFRREEKNQYICATSSRTRSRAWCSACFDSSAVNPSSRAILRWS